MNVATTPGANRATVNTVVFAGWSLTTVTFVRVTSPVLATVPV